MIDMNRLLTDVIGGGARPPGRPGAPPVSGATGASPHPLFGYAGALGTGAVAGGLAGLLFGSKSMRKVAGTALQVGAVAAIGGLAYRAYQNYRSGRPVVPHQVTDFLAGAATQPGAADAAVPASWVPAPAQATEHGRLLLRAMVAAAAADGHLDSAEYTRIRQQLQASGLNEEEQFFLSQLIMRPPTVNELAAAATTPELRAEVYVAARLAIDIDSAPERAWLDQLATALGLAPALRAHLDAAGEAAPAVAA